MTTAYFNKRLLKFMEDNGCKELTVTKCDLLGVWTPVDLIMREYYNNGGGNHKNYGFRTLKSFYNMVDYIREHQQELREKNLYNKDGYNPFGFQLWKDYQLD